jgi:hypothetical protein
VNRLKSSMMTASPLKPYWRSGWLSGFYLADPIPVVDGCIIPASSDWAISLCPCSLGHTPRLCLDSLHRRRGPSECKILGRTRQRHMRPAR